MIVRRSGASIIDTLSKGDEEWPRPEKSDTLQSKSSHISSGLPRVETGAFVDNRNANPTLRWHKIRR